MTTHDLPIFFLQSAPGHGSGFSTVRIEVSDDADRRKFQVGDRLAVVARRNVSLTSVVEGVACTHHRIEGVDPQVRPDLLTLRVAPKIPPHAWRQVTLVPVLGCQEYLAAQPDRAGNTVPVRQPEPTRVSRRYRPMRPAGSGLLPNSTQVVAKPVSETGFWGRLRQHLTASPKPTAPAPAVPELLWTAATTEHDQVMAKYLAYEMDPELVLLYPAVTDVTVPESAAFYDASARAGALRTETGPAGADHADSYHRAVTELTRRWRECEENARRLGHSHLSSDDAADLDKAVKLIRHARSAQTEFERASYLDRAQSLIGSFLTHPTLRISPAARKQLESLSTAPALTRGTE